MQVKWLVKPTIINVGSVWLITLGSEVNNVDWIQGRSQPKLSDGVNRQIHKTATNSKWVWRDVLVGYTLPRIFPEKAGKSTPFIWLI